MTRERGVLVSGERALARVAERRVNAEPGRRDPTVVAPPAVRK